jgi:hypothetical protein
MQSKRSPQKKLSLQLATQSPYTDFSKPSSNNLTPYPHSANSSFSEEESELAILSIINSRMHPPLPEFDSPIKAIQADSSSRQCYQQAKRVTLKAKLLQQFKHERFSILTNPFKVSTSANTASTSQGQGIAKLPKPEISDESLVNLESCSDEINQLYKLNRGNGNAGVISLMLKQSTLLRKNQKYRKTLKKAMRKINWTEWFMIGFKENSECYSLYGRRSKFLEKVAGDKSMPEKVEFSQIRKSFKYDWASQRFKDCFYCWDSDAIIIRTL